MKKVRHTKRSTTVIFTGEKKRRRFKLSKKRREQNRLANRRWRSSPQGAYVTQRVNAKRRGIAWQFTFETWWKLWQESGHWGERGKKAGCYVMARRGDSGAYSPGNCLIARLEVNCKGAMVTAGLLDPKFAADALPFADVPF